MSTDRYEHLRIWLERACLFFALLGIALVVAGRTALFAVWREAISLQLFDTPTLPEQLHTFAAATDGILGGSIAGKWVAAWWLVRHPLKERKRWAWNAMLVGLLAWFTVDSAQSLIVGASANVWMVNAVPLIIVGGLLLAMRAHANVSTTPSPPPSRSWRALEIACVIFAIVGIVVAFGSRTPIFDVYNAQIGKAWFDGTMTEQAILWERFAYGPVGATFTGHFLMLAIALRYAPSERWVMLAVPTSMLAWFGVDSASGLVHAAYFNILMINIPSFLAIIVIWFWARKHESTKD